MSETTADVPSKTIDSIKEKTYNIITKEKSYTAKAFSIAWTENGQFVLLMNGEETRHLIVAANMIAVTEQ
ncbi:MAG: hypothetical protein LV479_07045 [Methylacidiphilales bacterium]|nr:hypothetical protein [Candidatus Methylacidiphilales bacterium]